MKNRKSITLLFQALLMQVLFSACTSTPDTVEKAPEKTGEVNVSNISEEHQSTAGKTAPFAELNIYYVNTVEWAKGAENIGFVSLSDDYPLSDHPDSLAIPDVSGLPYDSIQYFKLEGKYRKQFLRKTGLSENDKLFVFNYSTGKLLSFPVRKLAVSALISIYESENDLPFDQGHYLIGFALDKSLLSAVGGGYYNHVLVAAGKENPFMTKKLKLIAWKKARAKQFPALKSRPEVTSELKGFVGKETYTFELDTLQFFLRELKDKKADYERSGRHVVVINKHSGKVEFEDFYTESEGIGMAPLNLMNSEYPDSIQWTGQLFKNRNPVVFGFTYNSFGCGGIYFMGQPQHVIYTKCDNRH